MSKQDKKWLKSTWIFSSLRLQLHRTKKSKIERRGGRRAGEGNVSKGGGGWWGKYEQTRERGEGGGWLRPAGENKIRGIGFQWTK